ncbi:MAG: efflux RND transporter periplasmic adaptor subunit [Planctomycetota bacterium]
MKLLTRLSLTVIAVAGMAAAAYVWQRETPPADKSVASASTVPDTTELKDVQLPEGKLQNAQLSITESRVQTISPENFVPGRLQYDDRRHVEIRTAAAGVVRKIHVRPGDTVKAGDVLAELDSPEVGDARADVLQRQSEVRIAQQNRDWQQSTCDGLKKLSEAIRQRTPVDNIRSDFKDVVLGKSRDQLLSGYSDLLLAETLVEAAQRNAKSGVFPSRTIEERENSRDSKEAALLAGLEEQSFDAQQRCQQAAAQLADAQRRFRISEQTVRTLLGHFDGNADPEPASVVDEGNLSLVQLVAPFDGTIEKRVVSSSERVAAGDSLITLADTSTLWVAADLREREWNALALKPGDTVSVSTSIAGLETCSATVHFVGREVDPSTNAVPLVAVIENSTGKLRPGMFVRVSVPAADSRQAVTVPESAIMQHDRQSFVFMPQSTTKFRRVNITPGIRQGGHVEVVSGLTSGEKVVSDGAFVLKSELLLQGESE